MSLSLRCYTGTDAATESAAVTSVALLSADAAAGDYPVAPGTNSYERWLAVKVDDPEGSTYSNFYVEVAGDLPEGVTIRVGVTATPATPTAATSTVARTTLTAGRRYTFDTAVLDAAGQKTAYLVLQESVSSGSASGPIDTQALTVGWVKG